MDSVALLLVLLIIGGIVLAVLGIIDNRRRDRERRDHL